MGLIKAFMGAAGGVLADQWKELFYTDALDKETLMVRGQKKVDGRSSNTKGHDNIITSGSGLLVADGQCAIIVDQGEIVEVCSEPGQYTYDASTEPTIFCGNLGEGIKKSWETFKRRFTFGGDTGKDQRVYFFNTKEIVDNKFGTPNPIPFKIVDRNINLDIDVSVRCSGVYSFRMADPILFYKKVCGNVTEEYRVDELGDQLKSEFIQALQPAMGKLSAMSVRPSDLPGHVDELAGFLNEALSQKWGELRGFEVVSVALNTVSLPEEDQQLIKEMQKAGAMRDPNYAAATLAAAQADAMRNAANNEAGAAMGFMGMGMAMNAGGANAANLFAMGQQQQQAAPQQPAQGSWTCSCGAVNTGKFCTNCGQPKPEAAAGKFCPNCGAKLAPGTKFCPECGTKLG